MPDDTLITYRTAPPSMTSATTTQRWGGLASFLLAVAFVVPAGIYLTGNLRAANGPLAYDLADFLYGPVWAASLVMAVFALRAHIGDAAPQRMMLALLAALVSAEAIVAVACIRAANRHYHLLHPELHLESSTTVLLVWTTLVAGVTATGLHFLGWSYVLLGWSGWTSRRLARGLSALYLIVGTAALFVYLQPALEGFVVLLGVVVSIWQGIVLWTAEAGGSR
jgi:hypothetical protein